MADTGGAPEFAICIHKKNGEPGVQYVFDTKREYAILGAHEECDIRILMPSIPPICAMITYKDEKAAIMGLESDGFVKIPSSGDVLVAKETHSLGAGDRFFVGEKLFSVQIRGKTRLSTSEDVSADEDDTAEEVQTTASGPSPRAGPSLNSRNKPKKGRRMSLLVTDDDVSEITSAPSRVFPKMRHSLTAGAMTAFLRDKIAENNSLAPSVKGPRRASVGDVNIRLAYSSGPAESSSTVLTYEPPPSNPAVADIRPRDSVRNGLTSNLQHLGTALPKGPGSSDQESEFSALTQVTPDTPARDAFLQTIGSSQAGLLERRSNSAEVGTGAPDSQDQSETTPPLEEYRRGDLPVLVPSADTAERESPMQDESANNVPTQEQPQNEDKFTRLMLGLPATPLRRVGLRRQSARTPTAARNTSRQGLSTRKGNFRSTPTPLGKRATVSARKAESSHKPFARFHSQNENQRQSADNEEESDVVTPGDNGREAVFSSCLPSPSSRRRGVNFSLTELSAGSHYTPSRSRTTPSPSPVKSSSRRISVLRGSPAPRPSPAAEPGDGTLPSDRVEGPPIHPELASLGRFFYPRHTTPAGEQNIGEHHQRVPDVQRSTAHVVGCDDESGLPVFDSPQRNVIHVSEELGSPSDSEDSSNFSSSEDRSSDRDLHERLDFEMDQAGEGEASPLPTPSGGVVSGLLRRLSGRLSDSKGGPNDTPEESGTNRAISEAKLGENHRQSGLLRRLSDGFFGPRGNEQATGQAGASDEVPDRAITPAAESDVRTSEDNDRYVSESRSSSDSASITPSGGTEFDSSSRDGNCDVDASDEELDSDNAVLGSAVEDDKLSTDYCDISNHESTENEAESLGLELKKGAYPVEGKHSGDSESTVHSGKEETSNERTAMVGETRGTAHEPDSYAGIGTKILRKLSFLGSNDTQRHRSSTPGLNSGPEQCQSPQPREVQRQRANDDSGQVPSSARESDTVSSYYDGFTSSEGIVSTEEELQIEEGMLSSSSRPSSALTGTTETDEVPTSGENSGVESSTLPVGAADSHLSTDRESRRLSIRDRILSAARAIRKSYLPGYTGPDKAVSVSDEESKENDESANAVQGGVAQDEIQAAEPRDIPNIQILGVQSQQGAVMNNGFSKSPSSLPDEKDAFHGASKATHRELPADAQLGEEQNAPDLEMALPCSSAAVLSGGEHQLSYDASSVTVIELKACLKSLGEKQEGIKSDLAQRLVSSLLSSTDNMKTAALLDGQVRVCLRLFGESVAGSSLELRERLVSCLGVGTTSCESTSPAAKLRSRDMDLKAHTPPKRDMYMRKTVASLRSICAKHDILVPKRSRKDDIINLLISHSIDHNGEPLTIALRVNATDEENVSSGANYGKETGTDVIVLSPGTPKTNVAGKAIRSPGAMIRNNDVADLVALTPGPSGDGVSEDLAMRRSTRLSRSSKKIKASALVKDHSPQVPDPEIQIGSQENDTVEAITPKLRSRRSARIVTISQKEGGRTAIGETPVRKSSRLTRLSTKARAELVEEAPFEEIPTTPIAPLRRIARATTPSRAAGTQDDLSGDSTKRPTRVTRSSRSTAMAVQEARSPAPSKSSGRSAVTSKRRKAGLSAPSASVASDAEAEPADDRDEDKEATESRASSVRRTRSVAASSTKTKETANDNEGIVAKRATRSTSTAAATPSRRSARLRKRV